MNELIAHIKAENAKTQAWVDEAPGRWAGMVVEDPAHWEGYGIHTVAQYERYMATMTIYDLYKEVHGHKPRYIDFDAMSDEEFNKFYDNLLVELEEERVREAEAQDKAVREFEAKVEELVSMGAGNRETALRWLKDAEDDDYMDDGYFEYSHGLPFGYIKGVAA
jgi:hypothetical protein